MTPTAVLFAEVAEVQRPLLLRIAGKLAGPDQAADVVQQALLNAWQRHVAKGRPVEGGEAGMTKWLMQVTHTAALDARRYDWVRPWRRDGALAPDPEFWLGSLPDPDTPEEIAERRESSAEAGAFLSPFLERLSPVYREVLWTTYAEDRTPREVAEMTGRLWTTVKSLRNRARLRVLELAAEARLERL